MPGGPSSDTTPYQRGRQRRTHDHCALRWVSLSKVDDGLCPPQHVNKLDRLIFGDNGREGEPDRQ